MTTPAQSDARATRILHAALTGGVASLAVVAYLVPRMLGPLLSDDRSRSVAAAACTAMAVLPIGIGLLVARRRLPAPGPGSPDEAYWTPEARGAAIMLWALADGGAICGFVGYMLTARLAPALMGVVGLAALLWYTPGRLARE